jgi:hypothetical protein
LKGRGIAIVKKYEDDDKENANDCEVDDDDKSSLVRKEDRLTIEYWKMVIVAIFSFKINLMDG